MSNVLLVPVRLNALRLTKEITVAGPMADFSKLPYATKGMDHNPNIANIAEEVLSSAFQNQNFRLKPGLHLHWLLPSALTKEVSTAMQNLKAYKSTPPYPRVPNRWLISRSISSRQNPAITVAGNQPPQRPPIFLLDKQWLLESNFLHPGSNNELNAGSSNIPYPASKTNPFPFRHMGRCQELGLWGIDVPKASYMQHLTAVGYGTPAFASYYPNCHSVFGWHEAEISVFQRQVKYEVIGFYDSQENDYIKQFKALYKAEFQKEHGRQASLKELLDTFKKSLRLNFDSSTGEPDEMICYGSVIVPAGNLRNPKGTRKDDSITVVVGNTGTEALSAFLGKTLDPERPYVIEDQLEAIQLAGDLENRQLDVGPKFIEARHRKEFVAESGGSKWTIGPDHSADTGKGQESRQLTLPLEMAHQLNALNVLQQSYEKGLFESISQRKQLFADWYKYMLATYPPEDTIDQYPNIDEVQHFIRKKGFSPLAKKEAAIGVLELQKDLRRDKLIKATAKDSRDGSIARAVSTAINELLLRLENYNRSCELLKEEDIVWNSFLERFPVVASDPLKPALVKLFSGTSVPAQKLLAKTALNANETQVVLDELNRVLKKASFFTPADFSTVDIPKTIQDLESIRSSDRQPEEKVRLNRLYLQLIFPKHIKPNTKKWMALKPVAADPYWRPTEPVVLVSGQGVKPTHFEQSPEVLQCQILKNTGLPLSADSNKRKKQVEDLLAKVKTEVGSGNLPETPFYNDPWNPFKLEWETEVFPAKEKGNSDGTNGQYGADFILENYLMAGDSCNFSPKKEVTQIVKGANLYEGSSLLSAGADLHQKHALDQFLKKQISQDILINTRNALADTRETEKQPLTSAEIKKIKKAYESKYFTSTTTAEMKTKDAVYTAIRAYEFLVSADPSRLFQALSGFNDALLMHKQTYQLAIGDPLAFQDYKNFSNEGVRGIVKNYNRVAPQPLYDFNPIRSGELNISSLRLVDTFGRIKDLNTNIQMGAERLYNKNSRFPLTLFPRITQPARVNFRWLSADPKHSDIEMNSHPATSPICGWILPNNLDHSLAFYDEFGEPQGAFTAVEDRRDATLARWDPSPGGGKIGSPLQIENPHLRKIAIHIQEKGASFVDKLVNALDRAQENIDPEGFAQHQSLSLLVGRPLALVRASLKFELKGEASIHQGWEAFVKDMARNHRETNGFTRVKLPVRLGEYKQLHDGLAGYWIEEDSQIPGEAPFYSPQADIVTNDLYHTDIVYHSESKTHISRSFEDEALHFSLLIDPRAAVHCSTGILPTNVLSLPPDQYVDALKKICITFLTAPIVTPKNQFQLPLPKEAGFSWSWISKNRTNWSEIGTTGILEKNQLQEITENADALWNQLQQSKWITEIDEGKAEVVASDQRKDQTLGGLFKEELPAIHLLLQKTHIGITHTDAQFKGKQVIREGWLKLCPTDDEL